ncbi:MAG: choice-of-anchor D domain-containing protein, partial [Terracidiphilus sp.]
MRKFYSAVLLSLTVIFCLYSADSAVAQTTVFPASVTFGNQAVGVASVAHAVSLTNTQAVPLTIDSISVSGAGYALVPAPTAPCPNPGTVPAGKTCNLRVSLTPGALGAAPAGTLTFTTNATNSPQSLSMSGNGVAPLTLSAAFFAFGATSVGGTSPTKLLTITNLQASSISLTSVGFTGPFSLDTSANTTCPQAGGTVSGTLAGGASCAIGVVFKPTMAGSVSGQMTINDGNSIDGTQSMLLSGFGGAEVVPSPVALAFGSVALGTTSAPQSITLLNGQGVSLHFTTIATVAPYAIVPATTTCMVGTPVAPNSSCTISVTFSPTTLGAAPVSALTFSDDAPNTPQTAGLTGNGIPPVTLLPTLVSFGNVVVGQTSALKTVTLQNNLATSLIISSLAVTPGTPYSVDPTSTCLSLTVAAGASCTVALTVTPTSLGAQPAGMLTATFGASNSPLTVNLSATGIAPVSLTPLSQGFGSLTLGLTSATKTLTLANNSTSSLTISGSVFNGPFVLDTSATTTCPMAGGVLSGTLTAGTSCVVGVQFAPTTAGATVGGQITVLDNAPNSPQTAALSGTGLVSVLLSPGTIAFGNVTVGTTGASHTVTVTNNQTVALNFSSISVPAPYAIVPATTTCAVGTPVAANGGSCIVSLAFSPTAPGVVPASALTINDDAPSTPQTVNLTGTGVGAVTLSPSTLAYGVVVVGQAVEKNVTVTNNQSVALTIMSITGLPAAYTLDATNTTCQLTPLTVPANTSCVLAVSLTATANGAQPGTVTVNYGGGLPSQSFTLTANAIHPVLISPTVLSFASQFVGASSAAQTVTLTNEQNIALNIASVTITGADPNDFSVTTTCPTAPASLAALTPCPLLVVFSPTASGTRTATLNINDDAQGSPQTISLTGSANAPVTISPQSITNYTAPVGTTSAFKTLTITNAQTATTLHFSNLKLIGDYIQSSTSCPIGGAGIAPGASCTIAVQIDPSIGGARAGQLQVYDDAVTSPQVVNLSGTGTSPLTISPTGLGFSAQTVGTSSVAKTITLTNHEVQQETFTLGTTGDFTASSNCTGGIIAANSSCFVYVTFTPSSVLPSTTRTGTLTIANAAAGTSTTWVTPVTGPLSGSATATNPAPAVSVV